MKHDLLKSLGNKPRTGKVIVCWCGKDFYISPSRVVLGRKNYCSFACVKQAKATKPNRTCRVCKKRFYRYPSQEKHRGFGKFCSKPCKGVWMAKHWSGEGSPSWKGQSVSYSPLHHWVRKNKGRAQEHLCAFCKKPAQEWANKDHLYTRDLDQFVAMCIKCHRNHDNMFIRIDQADKFFSRYVRESQGWKCQRCSRQYDRDEANALQASHYFGRANEATRFAPENVDALCMGCHQLYGSTNREDYREFKIKQLGAEGFKKLIVLSNSYKRKDRKLEAIRWKAAYFALCQEKGVTPRK